MAVALAEANKARGQTSPNPAVGALLVSSAGILARGYHRQAGADHAEIACLKQIAGPIPRSAVLYITLEPCSTAGRTAPCLDYIRARGIRHVVIGAIDPNPRHAGRAIDLLRNAQVDVTVGVLAKECTRLNEGFNKWIVTREPFVIAKCGMTLDGRLTRPPPEPRWITSRTARAHARQLRASVDAVLVGAETVRVDNPRLTWRGTGSSRQPWRVILTRSGRLPSDAKVLSDRHRNRTLLLRATSLRGVLRQLGSRQITSVLIEGGGQILTRALDERLIDKVQIYLGPLLTGGPGLAFGGKGAESTDSALRLHHVRYERIDDDVCVSGYMQPEDLPDATRFNSLKAR